MCCFYYIILLITTCLITIAIDIADGFIFDDIFVNKSTVSSDSVDICEDGLIESITQLENRRIVIFRQQMVWLLSPDGKQLVGPYNEIDLFASEFTGNIESAVTIQSHDTVIEFVGTGIYMNSTHFLAYKNFKPYNIEWGSLIYMPHRGLKSSIGSTNNEAVGKLMAKETIAAYFDPLDKRTKFVFRDYSILAFHFEVGVDYEKPMATSVYKELKHFGLQNVIKFEAAFTRLAAGADSGGGGNNGHRQHELVVFVDDKYCVIPMVKTNDKVFECDWRPTKEFLHCDTYSSKLKISNIKGTGALQNRPNDTIIDNNHYSTEPDADRSKSNTSRQQPCLYQSLLSTFIIIIYLIVLLNLIV